MTDRHLSLVSGNGDGKEPHIDFYGYHIHAKTPEQLTYSDFNEIFEVLSEGDETVLQNAAEEYWGFELPKPHSGLPADEATRLTALRYRLLAAYGYWVEEPAPGEKLNTAVGHGVCIVHDLINKTFDLARVEHAKRTRDAPYLTTAVVTYGTDNLKRMFTNGVHTEQPFTVLLRTDAIAFYGNTNEYDRYVNEYGN